MSLSTAHQDALRATDGPVPTQTSALIAIADAINRLARAVESLGTVSVDLPKKRNP